MGKCFYQNVQCGIVKEQEASRLLRKLGIKTPFSKITLFGDILF